MEASPRHQYLHVANGTSVTRTLETAGVPGLRSIWADPLHEGPVPGGLTDAELMDVRRRYHAAPASGAMQGASDPRLDPVNDMRRWREVIAQHESYGELVLWFEHDLFDQLNLIHLLTLIRERVPTSKPVSLICIDSFPGHPDFKGLGELTAGELAPLLDTRAPVTDAQYLLAGRAWKAFRDATPEALDALRGEDTTALPYLADALTRFLQEYPWTSDGLSRTERRLLQLAKDSPLSLASAFPRMGQGDRFYTVTDLSLLATVHDLEATSPSLLSVDRSAASERTFRARITSTEAGRSVLSGNLDRVEACGVDRWLGGVHLQGRQHLWRWDHPNQRVTRA
jgi:hypothetical protein